MESKKRSASFKGLECYKLTNIYVSDTVIGHGSYANVFEVDYMGLRCAGKKIHDVLLQQGNRTYQVRRFEEECSLLSEIRHPNIVQFLGVCFQSESTVPTLVMEYLPTNLTSCIDKYGILPQEISYSILHDVALGLCYLHSEIPPIVHRDLSSNNVLLASNMTAKISDLGVAKIFNLTPLQVSRMTQTPGTPAYMPPEVMTADPIYNESVDEFSFGVMMVHILSGNWPEPQCGPIRTESGKLIPVSEVERREKFLQAIGEDHPLFNLITKCLNNDSQRRAHVSEIVDILSEMVRMFPRTFANELEMLSQLNSDVQQKELEAIEVLQELEKCKRENEKLKEEISQLNELLAKDNDLISNTIHILQNAQEQKQKKLQELQNHGRNDSPHPEQEDIVFPEDDEDSYQETTSSPDSEEIHGGIASLEDTCTRQVSYISNCSSNTIEYIMHTMELSTNNPSEVQQKPRVCAYAIIDSQSHCLYYDPRQEYIIERGGEGEYPTTLCTVLQPFTGVTTFVVIFTNVRFHSLQ
jgi:serine/threonine protein kinase